MPENTEVLNKKDDIVAPENVEKDSGTDSDSDNDSIPELEETGAGAGQTQGNSKICNTYLTFFSREIENKFHGKK